MNFVEQHMLSVGIAFVLTCVGFIWRDLRILRSLRQPPLYGGSVSPFSDYIGFFGWRIFFIIILISILQWIFGDGLIVFFLTCYLLFPNLISGALITGFHCFLWSVREFVKFISFCFKRELVQPIQQTQHIHHYKEERVTNNYQITASQSILNIDSNLKNVRQSIQSAPSIVDKDKEELVSLFEQLKAELGRLPESQARQGEVVSTAAKQLGEELHRPNPLKEVLKMNVGNLVEAAKALQDVLPIALSIAQKISEFVAKTFS